MNKRLNRLNKELADLKNFPAFSVRVDENNSRIWYISFKGAENTLYAGEDFTLQFKFSNEYVSIQYIISISIFSLLIVLRSYLLGIYLRMNIFILMDLYVFLYYIMNGRQL